SPQQAVGGLGSVWAESGYGPYLALMWNAFVIRMFSTSFPHPHHIQIHTEAKLVPHPDHILKCLLGLCVLYLCQHLVHLYFKNAYFLSIVLRITGLKLPQNGIIIKIAIFYKIKLINLNERKYKGHLHTLAIIEQIIFLYFSVFDCEQPGLMSKKIIVVFYISESLECNIF